MDFLVFLCIYTTPRSCSHGLGTWSSHHLDTRAHISCLCFLTLYFLSWTPRVHLLLFEAELLSMPCTTSGQQLQNESSDLKLGSGTSMSHYLFASEVIYSLKRIINVLPNAGCKFNYITYLALLIFIFLWLLYEQETIKTKTFCSTTCLQPHTIQFPCQQISTVWWLLFAFKHDLYL